MKEFKFVAFICPLERLLFFGIPFVIIMLVLFFTIDIFAYFWYLLILAFINNILFFSFFLKFVKITFSHVNEMKIYYNGKEKYKGNADSLQYVKGGDIANNLAREDMEIVFADRHFTFGIWEKTGAIAGKTTKHTDLLRYMFSVYDLQKGASEKKFLKESFIYNNPRYTGISINEGYNKNEH